jgi:hypothetical protein
LLGSGKVRKESEKITKKKTGFHNNSVKSNKIASLGIRNKNQNFITNAELTGGKDIN